MGAIVGLNEGPAWFCCQYLPTRPANGLDIERPAFRRYPTDKADRFLRQS